MLQLSCKLYEFDGDFVTAASVTDFTLKNNLEISKSNEDNRNLLGKKKFDDCNFLRVEKISMIAISEV